MKIVKFGQGRLFAGFGDGGCAALACGGGVLFFGGGVEASYELAAGGLVFALNIPVGQWHTLRVLESGTVILEMKDGAYEPIGAGDVMER